MVVKLQNQGHSICHFSAFLCVLRGQLNRCHKSRSDVYFLANHKSDLPQRVQRYAEDKRETTATQGGLLPVYLAPWRLCEMFFVEKGCFGLQPNVLHVVHENKFNKDERDAQDKIFLFILSILFIRVKKCCPSHSESPISSENHSAPDFKSVKSASSADQKTGVSRHPPTVLLIADCGIRNLKRRGAVRTWVTLQGNSEI